MASSSAVLFLLLAVFAAGARAATFTITNNCGFTVWPAGIPVGGGFQLNSRQTSSINVPAGTSAGRIWGRTGCSFSGGRGSCATGDCGGALSCSLSGKPPTTLAEYTLGSPNDFYDISVIDGFNLPMDFSCSTGVSGGATARHARAAARATPVNHLVVLLGSEELRTNLCGQNLTNGSASRLCPGFHGELARPLTSVTLRCRDSGCPDAYHRPNDAATHSCNGNSNYQITFCP